MVHRRQLLCSGLALVLALPIMSAGKLKAATRRIVWSDLLHSVPLAAGLDEGEGAARRSGLEGQTVELTGYLLPADREGDLVYSFLLLPEYGGCIHTPSPPPDQIVLVTPSEPFAAKEVYQVVAVSGALVVRRERTQLFVLDGIKVVDSGYAISKALVRESTDAVHAPRTTARNPWGKLGQPKG